nr:MAG TPA: hypothetical protein [Caudoviricetes sp.]
MLKKSPSLGKSGSDRASLTKSPSTESSSLNWVSHSNILTATTSLLR